MGGGALFRNGGGTPFNKFFAVNEQEIGKSF